MFIIFDVQGFLKHRVTGLLAGLSECVKKRGNNHMAIVDFKRLHLRYKDILTCAKINRFGGTLHQFSKT